MLKQLFPVLTVLTLCLLTPYTQADMISVIVGDDGFGGTQGANSNPGDAFNPNMYPIHNLLTRTQTKPTSPPRRPICLTPSNTISPMMLQVSSQSTPQPSPSRSAASVDVPMVVVSATLKSLLTMALIWSTLATS